MQSAAVAEPALGDEGDVESDHCDCTGGDEEGLEFVRADV
jgi:hypothetical protein